MISVCIATYNGEQFIRQQLESVLLQLSPCDEVVISDNCSTDMTRIIINGFNDSRIKMHLFDERNLVANFENALSKAVGDIIFLSDQDDVWLDGRVNRLKNELQSCDLVMANCKVVDAQLNVLHASLFGITNPRSGVLQNLIKNSFTGCCMAFNRKVLESSLPFPSDIPMHDWWIGLVGELIGTVKFIEEPFLLYRRHGNNASVTSTRSRHSLMKRLSMRWVLIKNLWLKSI